jgi:uridine kinase
MAEWHDVPTGGIVIIEGCFSIRNELLPLYDVRIWIDSPKQISLERVVQRERDGSGNRYLWENVYRPAEEKYIEVQRPRDHADIVIDGTGQVGDISYYEVNVVDESDRWLNL